MASKVYFTSLRTSYNNSLLTKIQRLAQAAGLEDIVRKGGLTAVKLHFGERGGTAFIRPVLVRPVVEALLEAGARPFMGHLDALCRVSGKCCRPFEHSPSKRFRLHRGGSADNYRRRPRWRRRGRSPRKPQALQGCADSLGNSSGGVFGFAHPFQTSRRRGLWRRTQKPRYGGRFKEGQNGPALRGCAKNRL